MASSIFNLLPNLEDFHYATHYEKLFLNQHWVLVNGISKKKAVYIFKNENLLHIHENHKTIETSWTLETKNIFSIKTEDGKVIVKAYFKDEDILVLKKPKTNDCAVFINENSYSNSLNSVEDVQQFLHDKYKEKATNIIYEHEFYYIEKSKEFGPFTVEELSKKVYENTISEYCFVRDVNEYNYNKRLRIRDLIYT
ncbi:hypothetical protein [Oceanihabitans sediminis]|uniref:hypothetical protein n=1 Tax=Oceanihabitans sediminis TaxID=1812012 RepID=UPI00299DE742|nr:hypothetical protein [Oceanihabitans sediminis]MDX1773367.1 hypothetical protein [Oceanihabitans sediminis]